MAACRVRPKPKKFSDELDVQKKALPFEMEGPIVGVTGIEPMTSPTRTERATKLRHTPIMVQSCENTSDYGIIGYAGHFASGVTKWTVIVAG